MGAYLIDNRLVRFDPQTSSTNRFHSEINRLYDFFVTHAVADHSLREDDRTQRAIRCEYSAEDKAERTIWIDQPSQATGQEDEEEDEAGVSHRVAEESVAFISREE